MKRIPLAAFLFPLLIILFSFRLVVFDTGFYKSEFEKYGVYERFDKETADSAVENLISYMRLGTELSDFFNEKEKSHMIDVRSIIRKLLILLYTSMLFVMILLLYNRKSLSTSLFYGGLFTLIILLLFFILSNTCFDFIFHKFHEVSFSNDFWKLDPEVDNLKALMPDSFFYDALAKIFFVSFIVSALLTLVGFLGLKKFKYLKKSK